MAVAITLGAAGHAQAAVFEIGDDGALSVRSGGEEVASRRIDDAEPAPDVPDAAITEIAAPSVPIGYRAALNQSAARASLSPALLAAVVGRESAWNTNALSSRGASGLAQLMPATARMLGVDPLDPAANLAGGARYLRMLLDRFNGNLERALAAYNAGPGRVLRAGGVPAIAETQAYVATIFSRLAPTASAAIPGFSR